MNKKARGARIQTRQNPFLANDRKKIEKSKQRVSSDNKKTGRFSGKYRTMCVRLCDGYYWPIEFSVDKKDFAENETTCQSSCKADTRLYYYPLGRKIHNMIDLHGRPYSRLKYAYRYRKNYDPSCRCKAESWSSRARLIHKKYAMTPTGSIKPVIKFTVPVNQEQQKLELEKRSLESSGKLTASDKGSHKKQPGLDDWIFSGSDVGRQTDKYENKTSVVAAFKTDSHDQAGSGQVDLSGKANKKELSEQTSVIGSKLKSGLRNLIARSTLALYRQLDLVSDKLKIDETSQNHLQTPGKKSNHLAMTLKDTIHPDQGGKSNLDKSSPGKNRTERQPVIREHETKVDNNEKKIPHMDQTHQSETASPGQTSLSRLGANTSPTDQAEFVATTNTGHPEKNEAGKTDRVGIRSKPVKKSDIKRAKAVRKTKNRKARAKRLIRVHYAGNVYLMSEPEYWRFRNKMRTQRTGNRRYR